MGCSGGVQDLVSVEGIPDVSADIPTFELDDPTSEVFINDALVRHSGPNSIATPPEIIGGPDIEATLRFRIGLPKEVVDAFRREKAIVSPDLAQPPNVPCVVTFSTKEITVLPSGRRGGLGWDFKHSTSPLLPDGSIVADQINLGPLDATGVLYTLRIQAKVPSIDGDFAASRDRYRVLYQGDVYVADDHSSG